MKHLFLIISLLILSLGSHAKVEALFHPYDNTMDKIAHILMNAESSIDMALYNIDSSKSNPVIAALLSDEIQAKLKSGDLTIRILFEGYLTKEKNFEKMQKLEALGIDAKYLGATQKMHHKFATIDTNSRKPVLITGSANWSMISQRNYNENTLFFTNEPGITNNFQKEFNFLWSEAQEFGEINNEYPGSPLFAESDFILRSGIKVKFNTDNFVVVGDKKSRFRKSKKNQSVLTKELVLAIELANSKIEIATTRLKLRPVYDALLRAAARGVQIKIMVTMGEFEPAYLRKNRAMRESVQASLGKGKNKIPVTEDCENSFARKCSTSQNFAMFLSDLDYEGKENVQVRVKLFDLRYEAYLQKQMHSKYMIVDDRRVLTGSFNWSYSAEYNHFENLIIMEGAAYPEVNSEFKQDFNYLWDNGREHFHQKMLSLKNKEVFKCSFEPMSLTTSEIDTLLREAKKTGRYFKRKDKAAGKSTKGKLINNFFCKGKVKTDLSE